MKFSEKICLMILLKVTKKQDFTLSLEDTFFEKRHGVGQIRKREENKFSITQPTQHASDISIWSHLGWDLADHIEASLLVTSMLIRPTCLGRCHDVSLALK